MHIDVTSVDEGHDTLNQRVLVDIQSSGFSDGDRILLVLCKSGVHHDIAGRHVELHGLLVDVDSCSTVGVSQSSQNIA